ncbi:MAG: UpxY family transcription antiterminator [Bacteroidales bacterium]|nr:UpxY family transcription antiterminator [Bacteroidales bacterium]
MTQNSVAKEDAHWYVACVRSCQEKKVAESLESKAVRYYLPLRREVRRWSDRNKVISVPLISGVVFVRCRDSERAAILSDDPRIWRFLPDAGKAAVVRDSEMDAFRKMVEEGTGKLGFCSEPLKPGDRVRVKTGPLAGLECELADVEGRRCVAVRVGLLGAATMDLDQETLERI